MFYTSILCTCLSGDCGMIIACWYCMYVASTMMWMAGCQGLTSPPWQGLYARICTRLRVRTDNAAAPDREIHERKWIEMRDSCPACLFLPWNCLVAGLNIHTFDWHCRKDTSNWILITERIPFGKQDGDRQVDPAYDKMKDTLLISCPDMRDMFHQYRLRANNVI